MRVVLPYVEGHTELSKVTEALKASGFTWEAIEVSADDEVYFDVISALWGRDQDFCIVEHDIVIGPGTLQRFETCENLWCACPYPYLRGYYAGLGCARFREELMLAVPNLMAEVAQMSNKRHPPRHWCTVDGFMQQCLLGHGFHMCQHEPVETLGVLTPSHGCVT